MQEIVMLKIGARLRNGAQLLEVRPDRLYKDWSVVLCMYGSEFVVWSYQNETGECQSGHYFQSLPPAVLQFEKGVE